MKVIFREFDINPGYCVFCERELEEDIYSVQTKTTELRLCEDCTSGAIMMLKALGIETEIVPLHREEK